MNSVTLGKDLSVTPKLARMREDQVIIRGSISTHEGPQGRDVRNVVFLLLTKNLIAKISITEFDSKLQGVSKGLKVPSLCFYPLASVTEVNRIPIGPDIWQSRDGNFHFVFDEGPVCIRRQQVGAVQVDINPMHLGLLVYYAQIWTVLISSFGSVQLPDMHSYAYIMLLERFEAFFFQKQRQRWHELTAFGDL